MPTHISTCAIINKLQLLFVNRSAMPLPKSVSIAARATEAYTEAWNVVLSECWNMPPSFAGEQPELAKLLPYLRQLLTCCACAGLLENAMISITCGHCYCYECQFRAPLLKIQCRQCRERTGLVIENQLRLLVQCYKRMCRILFIHQREGSSVEDKLKVHGEEAEFDPIAEILREVQDGTKVSRAVLTVKPPEKYLKPSSATPKKDHAAKPSLNSSTVGATPSSTGESSAPEEKSSKGQKEEAQRTKRTDHKKKKQRAIKQALAEETTETVDTDKGSLNPKTWVKIDNAAVNSEEEVDVISISYPDNELSVQRFDAGPIEMSVLEVASSCLNQDYISVDSSTVSVIKDANPPVCVMEEPQTATTATQTEAIAAVTTTPGLNMRFHGLKRSRTPWSPRVVIQRHAGSRCPLPRPQKAKESKGCSSDTTMETSEDESFVVTPETMTETPEPDQLSALEPSAKKKRSYSHNNARCRCGNNNPQAPERVCNRNKCPCYLKGISCQNCLCKHCHNPF